MRMNTSAVGNNGMGHLNGNVLCAIDTETTGLLPGVHDIVEIAIIPLGANLEPMQGIVPLNFLIKPKRPQNITEEAMRINKLDLAEIEIHGFDPWVAADMLENWFEKTLKLAPGKKIAPLAKNWPFDAAFIRDWLKGETFNSLFHYHYRDVGPVALFFNDRADFHASEPPFPQTSLQQLAKKLEVQTDRAHRAMEDALSTARVYKKLMFEYIKS